MPVIETARLVLLDRNANVFLAQRPFVSNSRAGQLDFLGGRCDEGESLLAGALREGREEAGIDASGLAIEEVYAVGDVDGEKRFARHYFAGIIDRFPKAALSEHIGSVVLPAAIALDTLRFEPHRAALASALGTLSVA